MSPAPLVRPGLWPAPLEVADVTESIRATRACGRCGVEFVRWNDYEHPGSAATHCRPCYNTKARERQSGSPSISRPRQPCSDYDPTTGRRPQGRRWVELRAAVLAEESLCGICGLPVDKALRHNDKMSATVDHIVSLVLGGDYWDRANLRLAHRSCNSKEGNRLHQRQAERRISELEQRVTELETLLEGRLWLVS